MPEHIVVRCYSCQSFQAQQLRKTNDFVCKMCGAKQSVRKIYARSFKAADIRPIVQEYNMKRGEIEEEAAQNTVVQVELRAQRRMNEAEHVQNTPDSTPHKSNEWDQFLEEVSVFVVMYELTRVVSRKMNLQQMTRVKMRPARNW
jgi:predicted RNA-binding Zn-ribbon protein involved in translation (DUF1610 family)